MGNSLTSVDFSKYMANIDKNAATNSTSSS